VAGVATQIPPLAVPLLQLLRSNQANEKANRPSPDSGFSAVDQHRRCRVCRLERARSITDSPALPRVETVSMDAAKPDTHHLTLDGYGYEDGFHDDLDLRQLGFDLTAFLQAKRFRVAAAKQFRPNILRAIVTKLSPLGTESETHIADPDVTPNKWHGTAVPGM
jgi:hypothetical protein